MINFKCNLNEIAPITKRGDEVRVLISPKTVGSTQLIMGVASLAQGKTITPHVHDYSEECFFVLSGTGTLHLNGIGSINFNPGDSILVPKGIEHWVENTGSEILEVVFASAPLANNPANGHRDLNKG